MRRGDLVKIAIVYHRLSRIARTASAIRQKVTATIAHTTIFHRTGLWDDAPRSQHTEAPVCHEWGLFVCAPGMARSARDGAVNR